MLTAALANVINHWNNSPLHHRIQHCLQIYNHAPTAWDIIPLNSGSRAFGGSGNCTSATTQNREDQTVTVGNRCFLAITVNYILFGLIFNLCHSITGILPRPINKFFDFDTMILLIISWKVVKYRGKFAFEAVTWAIVGWNGGRGIPSSVGHVPHCQPNQNKYLTPFRVWWDPCSIEK
jgi:hypothetical protein